MVASGFSLANTVLPATSTSQPAAYTSAALASVMPPSISITAREPAAVDLPAELGHFLGRSFDERLSAESRLHAHHEHQIEFVQVGRDGRDGRLRLDRHPGLGAGPF